MDPMVNDIYILFNIYIYCLSTTIMTHKEHQEHNNHDTTKNGVIFELEDLSHPTGWLVGWLVANSNELFGSGKFLMEGTKNNICKNMEV